MKISYSLSFCFSTTWTGKASTSSLERMTDALKRVPTLSGAKALDLGPDLSGEEVGTRFITSVGWSCGTSVLVRDCGASVLVLRCGASVLVRDCRASVPERG